MSELRVFRRQARCQVLGPGVRYVLWVQGCPFACPGCLVPQSWDARGGEAVTVRSLAREIMSTSGIEGVTFSGGEPFAQAGALVELIDELEGRLGLMSYTGFRYNWLQRHGSSMQRELLSRLDLLIDGRYRQELHADLLWRGSSNQTIRLLSDRYRGALPSQDRSQGLEFEFHARGTFTFAGVPPTRDYMPGLKLLGVAG